MPYAGPLSVSAESRSHDLPYQCLSQTAAGFSCRSPLSTIHGQAAVWLLDVPLCSANTVLPEGLLEVTEEPLMWSGIFFKLGVISGLSIAALCLFISLAALSQRWVNMTQPLALSWQSKRTEMYPCVHPPAYL